MHGNVCLAFNAYAGMNLDYEHIRLRSQSADTDRVPCMIAQPGIAISSDAHEDARIMVRVYLDS